MSEPKMDKAEQRTHADFLVDKLLDLAPNLATLVEWEFSPECVLKLQVADASFPAKFSTPSRHASTVFQELLHSAVDVFGAHVCRASQSSYFSPIGNPWIVFRVFYAMGVSELEVQFNVGL